MAQQPTPQPEQPEQPAPQPQPASLLPPRPVQPQPKVGSAEEEKLEAANREKACEQLSAEGRKHFGLIEFDSGEEMVTEIRKHPIGLIAILLSGFVVIVTCLVVAAVVSTANLSGLFGGGNDLRGIIVAGCLFLILFAVIGTLIGVFLYRSNVIYVTSEKVAQVLYPSLFHRKVSQLSIGDIQDITVSQNGILPHIFNYGRLVVETSGEQDNYIFTMVPDPYVKSRAIVGSHERNLQKFGN